jgi:hypothetical protein
MKISAEDQKRIVLTEIVARFPTRRGIARDRSMRPEQFYQRDVFCRSGRLNRMARSRFGV